MSTKKYYDGEKVEKGWKSWVLQFFNRVVREALTEDVKI